MIHFDSYRRAVPSTKAYRHPDGTHATHVNLLFLAGDAEARIALKIADAETFLRSLTATIAEAKRLEEERQAVISARNKEREIAICGAES